MFGKHCVKSWSSTQATRALSSAEAELYAMIAGAAQALGTMTLLDVFGLAVPAVALADAGAAIGMVRCAGLGKLRHLNVRCTWPQDHLKSSQMELRKAHVSENPAEHGYQEPWPSASGQALGGGPRAWKGSDSTRAGSLRSAERRGDRAEVVEEEDDKDEHEVVRVHATTRRCFFTPVRVQVAPPAKAVTASRLMVGSFVDMGEVFRVCDC